MPATIRDVAQAAGVSVATVSRALNGANNVLPGTRDRIVEVAAALRFSPSGAARSLITRRSDTVGALLPDLFGEYFSELIRGIDQAARARRLHLLVSSSHGDADEAAAALRAMHGRVDGLIVMSPHADAAFLADNLDAGVPAVLVNSGVAAASHRTLAVDNHGGARAMVDHLAARGYRRIAFIGGPAGNHEARERRRGWHDALGGDGAGPAYDGDFTEAAGAAAGRAIAAERPRPDAVFAANDMMAIGCIAALVDAGLDVPRDIAVAGFDDIPAARHVSPALTTVRVGIAALGRLALESLVDSIEHPQSAVPSRVTLPTELVVRRSCGAGPAGASPPEYSHAPKSNNSRRSTR